MSARRVADETLELVIAGFEFTAFITDVHSRKDRGLAHRHVNDDAAIGGRARVAVFSRRIQLIDGMICHSDAGIQYVSVAYSERLAELGACPSIGSIVNLPGNRN